MINILRIPVDKVDSMQKQIGNISREMEILRKNQSQMLEIKTLQQMNNAFDGLMSRLDMAEKRISDLEGISLEVSKTEKQRKSTVNKQNPQNI